MREYVSIARKKCHWNTDILPQDIASNPRRHCIQTNAVSRDGYWVGSVRVSEGSRRYLKEIGIVDNEEVFHMIMGAHLCCKKAS